MNIKQKIFFFIILIESFFFRIVINFLPQNNFYTFEPDSYYHLKRIFLILKNASLGYQDLYRNIDYNLISLWPIYYTYFYAIIIKIFSFGNLDDSNIEFLASLIPPFSSLLSITLLFLILKRININFALLSCFIFSFLPININISNFGQIDHHAFEILAFLFSNYSFILFLEKNSLKNIFILSISFVLLFLIWGGSTLYIGIIFLLILFLSFKEKEIFEGIYKSFVYGGLILLPFYTYSPDTNNFNFNYDSPSLFQPFILISIGLFFYNYFYFFKHKKINFFYIFLFLCISFPIISSLLNGLSFIFLKNGGYSFTDSVAELKPLHTRGLDKITKSLTLFIFFVPFLVIKDIYIYIKECFKNRNLSKLSKKENLLLLDEYLKDNMVFIIINFYFIIFFLITLKAQRFSYILNIFLAPIIILFFYYIKEKFKNKNLKNIIPILFFFLIFIPISSDIYSVITIKSGYNKNTESFFKQIDKNIVNENIFFNTIRVPKYTILSSWDLGHIINYRSKKAVVSDNFGNNYNYIDNFIFEQNESKALKFLTSNLSKYVLISSNVIMNYPDSFIDNFQSFENNTYLIKYPTEKIKNTVYSSLYFFDGIIDKSIGIKGTDHLRLVLESDEKMPLILFDNNSSETPYFLILGEKYPEKIKPKINQFSKYKLFEYVKGCLVFGKTKPYTELEIKAQIKTNTNRIFYFSKTIYSNNNGDFSFTATYGKDNNSSIKVSDYVIKSDYLNENIEITNKDVLNGLSKKIISK